MSEPRGLWTIKPSMREVEEAIDAERRHRKEAEAERDAYRALLLEALDEYGAHQSWRCGHPPHFYYADADAAARLVERGDCPCGLDEFCKRARAVLAGNHDQGSQT